MLKCSGRFRARLWIDGKTKYLGTYGSVNEASDAYDIAIITDLLKGGMKTETVWDNMENDNIKMERKEEGSEEKYYMKMHDTWRIHDEEYMNTWIHEYIYIRLDMRLLYVYTYLYNNNNNNNNKKYTNYIYTYTKRI
jgi:hypothetical protein